MNKRGGGEGHMFFEHMNMRLKFTKEDGIGF